MTARTGLDGDPCDATHRLALLHGRRGARRRDEPDEEEERENAGVAGALCQRPPQPHGAESDGESGSGYQEHQSQRERGEGVLAGPGAQLEADERDGQAEDAQPQAGEGEVPPLPPDVVSQRGEVERDRHTCSPPEAVLLVGAHDDAGAHDEHKETEHGHLFLLRPANGGTG